MFRTTPGGDEGAFSAADYLDYQRDSQSFAALAGYRQDIVDLTGGSQPVRLYALETTAGLLRRLRLPPLQGRVYSERTDAPSRTSRRGDRRAGVAAAPGRRSERRRAARMRLNGIPTTIIGVMPEGFVHPADADCWMLAPARRPDVSAPD